MKIIEALKQTKYLLKKLSDLETKIRNNCVDMDYEKPLYPEQHVQVQKWIQSYTDVVKEIGRLKFCLNKTNVSTEVTIEIGDNNITKTISEWITRRRELVSLESACWNAQCDGRRPTQQPMKHNETGEQFIANIRRYYDPVLRDNKLNVLREEPTLIDSTLEVVNATTDLLE